VFIDVIDVIVDRAFIYNLSRREAADARLRPTMGLAEGVLR
jgi:hypothetical protein